MTSDAREREADQAASRGDVRGARRLLEEVVRANPQRIDAWLKLTAMRRADGDLAGALAATAGALRVDPLHFMALLSRGRLLEASDDHEEAARTYLRALAQRDPTEDLPPALAPLVAHARSIGEAYRDRVAATYLTAADTDDPRIRRRIDRFVSNTLKRTRVYHSEPSHYHYPGLVEREFHDREDFPELTALEAATNDILGELAALLDGGPARAEPYIQYPAHAPVRQWSALNHSLDWTAFHLLRAGEVVEENARRCPRTMAAIAALDQPRIARRSPNAMFSVLKPHTRIPPHTGVANTRLVCHLPFVVPEGCWFRVGATTRGWTPGEAFVFDDTIEHEAANDSDEIRIVLIVDLWHPGLSLDERAVLTRVMEAEESPEGTPL